MLSIKNLNLCELCFEPLPPKSKKCPYCSGEHNVTKYITALPEGAILAGKYVVGKVLGKGGFGVTYLCYDLKDNKKVAIKEFFPDSLAHRDSGDKTVTIYAGESGEFFKSGAQKFYEEAKLVSHFNGNPNIIGVYEFFSENNTTYFVMEYLSGVDMKGYLKEKRKISEGEAIYIANRAIDALMIVHSTNTLHRDIAPDNIFLCDNGAVKLIDFGAARQIVANESKNLSVIIKQGFAPLEQYQSKGKQGPWTDIYALGVTLYFAVTGKMAKDAMTRIDEPEIDMTGVSEGLACILNKMMAVKIDNRYHDMFSIKRDLETLGIAPIQPQLKKKEIKNYCTRCNKEIAAGGSLCDDCKVGVVPAPIKKRNFKMIAIIGATALVLFSGALAVVGLTQNKQHFHNYITSEIIRAATCTQEGLATCICSECGQTTEQVIEKLEHNFEKPEIMKNATCQEEGLRLFTCSDCGFSKKGTIPKLNHSYSDYDVTTEPTCVEEGVRTSTCSVCGDEKTEIIQKLAHTYSEYHITKHATCVEEGVRTSTCSVCGDEKTEIVAKTDHSFSEYYETKAATCYELGERTATCSTCGEKKTEYIEKTSHNYSEYYVTTEPTCTREGIRTSTCSICGDSKTQKIAKTDHNYETSEIVKQPTDKEEGLRVYYCSCGSTKEKILPRSDHTHDFGNPEVTEEPTCTTEGTRTYYCSCGDTETEKIAMTAHNFETKVTVEPTQHSEGELTYTCSRCGAKETEAIPPVLPSIDEAQKLFDNKQYEEAFKLFEILAEHGNRDAQYMAGLCYFSGRGVSKNFDIAVIWFQKAAEQGDPRAQNNLGTCYDMGYGVAENKEKAVYWYQKAADQGLASAQWNLGSCYLHGIGVEKNYDKALEYIKAAAANGNATAKKWLENNT